MEVRIDSTTVKRGQILKVRGDGTYRVSVPPKEECREGETRTIYHASLRKWLTRLPRNVPDRMPKS